MEVQDKKNGQSMVHMEDLEEAVQVVDAAATQEEAEDIQEEALQTMVIYKVVVAVHILKESLKIKKHLQYQDATQVCRQIQAEMGMDMS